jgi:hypothetical protein
VNGTRPTADYSQVDQQWMKGAIQDIVSEVR